MAGQVQTEVLLRWQPAVELINVRLDLLRQFGRLAHIFWRQKTQNTGHRAKNRPPRAPVFHDQVQHPFGIDLGAGAIGLVQAFGQGLHRPAKIGKQSDSAGAAMQAD